MCHMNAHLGELSALALRPVHRQHQERVEHDKKNQRQEDEHQAGEPVEDRAVRVQFAQFGQLHCHAGRLQQIQFISLGSKGQKIKMRLGRDCERYREE